MKMLYDTYENNAAKIGKVDSDSLLCPIAHMTANIQLEIAIDKNGNFKGANIIPKEKAETIIPVTEESAGRASGIAPHALSDNLSYIAGDFGRYLGEKRALEYQARFQKYIDNLSKWNSSDYSTVKVTSIYKYLSKGCLMSDLIKCEIVTLNQEHNLSDNKILGQPYEKVTARFKVYGADNIAETWLDERLMMAYKEYYLSRKDIEGNIDICYMTGVREANSTNHPKGIVPSSYGAKLVSANDNTNFTFRGRYINEREACTISYSASQKAHNALKWLIKKQGYTVGLSNKRTYLCWNPKGKSLPTIHGTIYDEENNALENPVTMPEYRQKIRNTINGYKNDLDSEDDVVIMSLDAATTGRLSITYYNELKASDFLSRIQMWYETCCWGFQDYDKEMQRYITTTKSPTLKSIITFAFGTQHDKLVEVNDKIWKEQYQSILHCMVDDAPIPKNIVKALYQRASTPLAYNHGNRERLLSTACAIICKYRKGGETNNMVLDKDNSDRSYLFGRLLAVFEDAERVTYKKGENRETNAIRLQSAFVQHPGRIRVFMEEAINPYMQQLKPGIREYYKKLIEEITSTFKNEDLLKMNKRLEDTYLLGYYLQRIEIRNDRKMRNSTKNSNGEM